MAASYARHHAHPGDSVVVAFGHADIVEDSGLGSPYPYLWALPALVEDPPLLALDRLLVSRSARPSGSSPAATWRSGGTPGARLRRPLDRRYAVALRALRWVVLRHQVSGRS